MTIAVNLEGNQFHPYSTILNHGTTHLTYRIPGIRVKNLPVTRLPLRVIAQPWNVLGASQGG